MHRLLLRARVVWPVVRPPIDDGAVLVDGAAIAAVGRWPDLRREDAAVTDLGEVVLLPGLINAHCHLDYTGMAGRLPAPRRFTDWIAGIVALKAAWGFSEFARSWVDGAAMLLRSGVTTVADIEAVPELLPEVWQATPLRVHSFLELINLKSRTPGPLTVAEAARRMASLPTGRCRVGLSPHALYTVTADLLRAAAETARARGWLMTTHIAESAAEFEMFLRGRGEMFEWLRAQRDMADCGTGSPVAQLARAGVLGPNFLAVHVNHLAPGDADLLGRAGASVVHCPRSHAYFRHAAFPRRELQAAGVNVCLGTDSLASMKREGRAAPQLDLWAEMRAWLAADANLCPPVVLRLATVNGARALGRAGELGELSPGAAADVIAVPCAGGGDVAEALIGQGGPVSAVMIGGQWATVPGGGPVR
jgi:cytosine/adenosine deaminase-related metal-dependent hydrolase